MLQQVQLAPHGWVEKHNGFFSGFPFPSSAAVFFTVTSFQFFSHSCRYIPRLDRNDETNLYLTGTAADAHACCCTVASCCSNNNAPYAVLYFLHQTNESVRICPGRTAKTTQQYNQNVGASTLSEQRGLHHCIQLALLPSSRGIE